MLDAADEPVAFRLGLEAIARTSHRRDPARVARVVRIMVFLLEWVPNAD